MVFLFWLVSGTSSYRVVSRVFGMHRSQSHGGGSGHSTLSSTFQRPQKTWWKYPMGLQGWQDNRAFQKAAGLAAMSALSHQVALMVITACGVFHNICIGTGGIVAPEDKLEEDLVEDEEGNGQSVVLPGRISCLSWRRSHLTMTILGFFKEEDTCPEDEEENGLGTVCRR
ncbi:hypothetical protein MHYP_G00028950 [Metynnis hypsauchen]